MRYNYIMPLKKARDFAGLARIKNPHNAFVDTKRFVEWVAKGKYKVEKNGKLSKFCNYCRNYHPTDEFYGNPDSSDGLRTTCKIDDSRRRAHYRRKKVRQNY